MMSRKKMEANLDDLLHEYDSYVAFQPQTDVVRAKGRSWASNLLKELRKTKIRRPDIVAILGPGLISSEGSFEVWNLREQLVVAYIDNGDYAQAKSGLDILVRQFPGSARVARLSSMLHEAKGEFTEALALCDEILKKDLTNLGMMKRKICIKKVQQDWRGMAEDINEILKKFPSDLGSWAQLGELYLSLADNVAAVHCFEELVLLDPRNSHYHVRLAEALYSAGGAERVLYARKHYSIALTIQGPKFNKRALYGLVACCSLLGEPTITTSAEQVDEHDKKVNVELLRWAKDQLSSLVEEEGEVGPIAILHRAIAL